jgi:hypothetical protein
MLAPAAESTVRREGRLAYGFLPCDPLLPFALPFEAALSFAFVFLIFAAVHRPSTSP